MNGTARSWERYLTHVMSDETNARALVVSEAAFYAGAWSVLTKLEPYFEAGEMKMAQARIDELTAEVVAFSQSSKAKLS